MAVITVILFFSSIRETSLKDGNALQTLITLTALLEKMLKHEVNHSHLTAIVIHGRCLCVLLIFICE